MYHAKAKGKARHEVFDGSMSAPALDRMDLEMDLRSAISRHEFRLHYQPILRLDTGKITEVEALIRWQHEKRGLLQPDEFIGLTEETGLIVPIGQWVLSEACKQARVWQVEYPTTPPLVMSVNLSAKQFQNPKLLEEITQALDESGLAASCLKLEITESTVMQDAPVTLTKLNERKALGVRLAIDDFGTGYSSLGYLKRFPVDTPRSGRAGELRGLLHRSSDWGHPRREAARGRARAAADRAVAERIYRRVLATFGRTLGADPDHAGSALMGLASLYIDQQRYAEAEPLLRRTLGIAESAPAPSDDHRQAAVARVVGQLGQLEERQGRNAEADAHYRRALAIVDKLPPRFRNATGKCVQHYLRFLRANNRSQEAAAIEARLTR